MDNSKDKLVKKRLMYTYSAKEAIIEYLEKQASKGYILVKASGSSYYFIKKEPCTVKYSIEMFIKDSDDDNEPIKNIEGLIKANNSLGWEYVCSNDKMVYFYTKDEDATSISVDSQKELEKINKYEFLAGITAMLVYPLISVVFNMMGWLTDPKSNCAVDVFIGEELSQSILYTGLVLLSLQLIIKAIIFNRRNKNRAIKGEKLIFYTAKEVKINIIISAVIGIFMCIGFFAFNEIHSKIWVVVFGGMCCVGVLIKIVSMLIDGQSIRFKKLRITMGTIISLVTVLVIVGAIYVVVCPVFKTDEPISKNDVVVSYTDKKTKKEKTEIIRKDKLPISSKDLSCVDKQCKYIDNSVDDYKTVFGEYYKVKEFCFDKYMDIVDSGLFYEVLKTKVGFIKNSYIKMQTNDKDGDSNIKESKKEAKKWKAETVYLYDYEMDGDYTSALIVYDDCVVLFHNASEDYVQDNIELIYEKLVK